MFVSEYSDEKDQAKVSGKNPIHVCIGSPSLDGCSLSVLKLFYCPHNFFCFQKFVKVGKIFCPPLSRSH